jgi:Zn-dependent protease
MFRSWRLGKAFGIPLYLHPTILLLPAIILTTEWSDGWFNALLMVVLVGFVFGCVLLHELGHALTARAFGIRTVDITLYPMGGVASLEHMAEEPLQEMAIAVAGPAVNLFIICLLLPVVGLTILAGLPHGAAMAFHLGDGLAATAARFVYLLMVCNGGLMVFNLLPAFPMDGGRVFRAFLALALNRVHATEIAAGVGAALAALLGLVGVASLFVSFGNPMLILVAGFVLVAGRMELQAVRHQAEDDRQTTHEEQRAAHIAPLTPNYSGFRWDGRHRVWVLWRNGRPIEVYEGGAE